MQADSDAALLLRREAIAERDQRQDEIRLLDDLLAIEVEVRVVQQQRVVVRARVLEVPVLLAREVLGLLVHAEVLVERHRDRPGGVAPRRHLLVVDAQRFGLGPVLAAQLARDPHVP